MEVEALRAKLHTQMQLKLHHFVHRLDILQESFQAHNPQRICAQGYAQITRDSVVHTLKDIVLGEEFELTDTQSHIKARRIE